MNLFAGDEGERATAPYDRLARKALSAYGLSDVRLDLVWDAARTTFRASDGASKTSWALQLHPRGCDPRRILRELRWLASLHRETSVRVPEPILTRSGELIQSLSTPGVSGFRQVTLSTWLQGRRVPVGEWSSAEARHVGRTVGELHAHAERFDLPAELALPVVTLDVLDEVVDPHALAAAVAPNDKDLLTVAFHAVREAVSEIGTGPEVGGLIHGRLSPSRVRFAEGRAGIVGFGECRWGHYAFDVAALTLALQGSEGHETLLAALLDGYREARPGAAALADLLPPFGALRLLEELQMVASAGHAEGERYREAQRILGQLRSLFS